MMCLESWLSIFFLDFLNFITKKSPNESTRSFNEFCNGFVRDLTIMKSFLWSPVHSWFYFQNNALSLPHQWRICTCCALICIFLYMLQFHGITSVLQPSSSGLPSVKFETFGFIFVPRHIRLLFSVSVFSGAWSSMILRKLVSYWDAIVSIWHGPSSQIDSVIARKHWLLDAIPKFLDVNILILPIRHNFHDCAWLLGIQLANYKCVIRYVVACNCLIQCGIIALPYDEEIEKFL